MKNKLFILTLTLLLLPLLVSCCANVGVTKLKPYPPKMVNCNIDIYTSESEIKRPFEVVCLIDSRTGTTAFHDKTGAAAIEQSKSKACKCGADAILIMSVDTEGVTMTTWGKGKTILKAIRYTD